jgi:lysyl-tRNA synthetase class 2
MRFENLRARAQIISAIRRFFDDRDFLEVSTSVRIAAPAPEEYIDCPKVESGGFLRASPELQMKKLLALGLEKIYQIGPCFRDGETGSRHNPEFTMIEWYRRGEDYNVVMEDTKLLVTELFARFLPSEKLSFKVMKVRDAYRDAALWDPWENWNRDRFDYDMATVIEPELKRMGGGIFLTDYPPQCASLAIVNGEGSDAYAERWEFYYDGMELANAYSELCDSFEQKKRFLEAKEARKILNESDYPIDDEFLEMVSMIGKATGIALGIDRLIMVLLRESEISSVRFY